MLATGRLVTVTGPGGVGKSALAAAMSGAAPGASGNGAGRPAAVEEPAVRTVELSGVGEPALVPRAVAEACGLEAQSLDELADGLAKAAAAVPGGLLLVLDTCEHLAGGCSETASVLLERCPGLRVLATSRVPLGLPAERAFPLGPLHREAALELMVRLRREDGAGFTAPGLAAARQLIRQVESLPLAVHLLARRMRQETPLRLATELSRPGGVLELAEPGPDPASASPLPRHRSLRALVAWSFELCSLGERALWERLARSQGVVDLAAAEALAGGSGLPHWAVGRAFQGLARASVLLPVAGDQNVGLYRMPALHRAFALAPSRAG
ncbi:hypothetical protein BIV57_15695 [Mangrovactinospora gilvigrisea]|uniref:AAA+ ATPase domain-containing protein n=2 Tax=Mangrovactinospora gilvigrisea TaxID=1428644 RepID=A0A1J7BT00_9ACTN|nr:hypothetical protein BIV57_15695 [Mangrovactinospora gilvigrisea]